MKSTTVYVQMNDHHPVSRKFNTFVILNSSSELLHLVKFELFMSELLYKTLSILCMTQGSDCTPRDFTKIIEGFFYPAPTKPAKIFTA